MQRIAKPNAPILVVGPDVYKTINLWKVGEQPWWMVESVLEHADMNYQPDREHEWWDGAHHHWNCHEARVQALLEGCGFANIVNVFGRIPNNPGGSGWHDAEAGITWPVIGKHHWQLSIKCNNIPKV